jgi:hypothetical protein
LRIDSQLVELGFSLAYLFSTFTTRLVPIISLFLAAAAVPLLGDGRGVYVPFLSSGFFKGSFYEAVSV